MPLWKFTVIEKQEVATETCLFRFAKPAGFEFKPGQFVTLIYDTMPYTDGKGNRRSMSIASSPTEPTIDITMRMGTSAFKRSIDEVKPGTILSAMGPFGTFTMPDDQNIPLVFLAGGVGITPFRSMMKYIFDSKQPRQVTLLYGNNCMADAAYLSEFANWSKQYPNFKYLPTLSDTKRIEPEWKGSVGFISATLLQTIVPDVLKPTYMIVGPPGMVEAMIAMLKGQRVPEAQIRVEKFTGY